MSSFVANIHLYDVVDRVQVVFVVNDYEEAGDDVVRTWTYSETVQGQGDSDPEVWLLRALGKALHSMAKRDPGAGSGSGAPLGGEANLALPTDAPWA